jgi:hypothetical protein
MENQMLHVNYLSLGSTRVRNGQREYIRTYYTFQPI